MDIARLRRGELIAAVSGLALLIIMFLPWFGAGGEVGEAVEAAQELGFAEEVDTDFSAWQSFDFIDLILLLTVIAAAGLAALTATARTVALPVAASAITAGLGILATLLVLYRLIDPPEELGREFGVWLGLIAAAGVAIGGWLSMQEEGTSFGDAAGQARDRFSGGGGAPPPPPGGTTGAPPPTEPPPPAGGPPSPPPPPRP